MATAITPVSPNQDGVAPAVPVAADTVEGNSVPNKRNIMLVLENTDAGPHDVVFTTPATVGGFDVAEHTVSIPAGATLHFGNFDSAAFGGVVTFTAASATVMVSAYLV